MEVSQDITTFKRLESVIDEIMLSDMVLEESDVYLLISTFFLLNENLTRKECRLSQNDVIKTRKLDDDADDIVEESLYRATCSEKLQKIKGLPYEMQQNIFELTSDFKEMASLTKGSVETKKEMLSILKEAGLTTEKQSYNSGCMVVFILLLMSSLTLFIKI